jgi:hypothetical protein
MILQEIEVERPMKMVEDLICNIRKSLNRPNTGRDIDDDGGKLMQIISIYRPAFKSQCSPDG